jgi:hypothetical protein
VAEPLLQQIAWGATAIGALVAAGSLLVAAGSLYYTNKANSENRKQEKARFFWLDLREMFAQHDAVHRKLLRGG